MSMLSAQCDELRKMADQLQKRGTFNPLMRGAATAMREAADTIWHLRNQLNDLQAENESLKDRNAKLCKLVAKAHACKTEEGCCEDCYQDEGCCPIEREMQELGIETDD